MVIIVESGATKTDWRSVAQDGTIRAVQTAGMNPSCVGPEGLNDIVREAIPVLNPDGKTVRSVFFYGAGLVSQAMTAPLEDAMSLWCPFAQVEFHSDLLAAARALFGDDNGIAAIMGTGSNSCLYEDGKIVGNIRPGGYVLGDEGSGASVGKVLLSDFIKGMLPAHIECEFVERFGLDYAGIVQKVYREPAPSAFMASFAPFVLEHSDDPYIRSLLETCLESFVARSLSRYERSGYSVGVVGSFGCACEGILREIGARYGLTFSRFIKSPIDQLVQYHGI